MNVISFWVLTMLARAFLFMGLVGTLTVFCLTYAFGAPAVRAGTVINAVVIMCDTEANARHVLDTWKADGFDAAKAAMTTLRETKNEDGEPTCGLYRGQLMPLRNVASYPMLKQGDEVLDFHIGEVMAQNGKTYYVISLNEIVVAVLGIKV